MPTVPLDEGWPGRRRVGPFWIEEGLAPIGAGAALLVVVAVLYILAITQPA